MAKASEDEVARFLDAWLQVRQLIQAANFNRFHRAGLSATQFMTLNLLPANEDGMTLTELARRLNLSAATVAKTIDSLEARRMLRRTPATADRRQVMIRLTAAGRRLHNAASAEFHQRMAGLLHTLGSTQRRDLIAGLESLAAASADATPVDAAAKPVRSARPVRRL